MKHLHHCKFCRCEVILEIDDSYNIADPLKLFAFAACNRCADVREERGLIEHKILKVCLGFAQLGKAGQSERDAVRATLVRLTHSYAKMVAKWHNLSGELWDEQFVDMLMEKPKEFGKVLSQYWRTFRISQKAQLEKQQ